jgi:hypothetical protein
MTVLECMNGAAISAEAAFSSEQNRPCYTEFIFKSWRKYMKQRLIATALIVVAWGVLDYLFHGILLHANYEATAQLWRPMAEMKTGLMNVISIVSALLFILIFCRMVPEKTLQKGIKLGVLVGLLIGVSMGIGAFTYMPITVKIAAVWAIAAVVKFTIAGAITGKIVTTNL